jgi:hypothetical protein
MYNTLQLQAPEWEQLRPQVQEVLTQALAEALPGAPAASPRGRGRPETIVLAHVWLSLLTCVLLGMKNYQTLWRHLCSKEIGRFLPIHVTDDAVVKRLQQAGLAPLQELFTQVSCGLARWLTPQVDCPLAPFATRVVALDETTCDAMQRHLVVQRDLPDGDVRLLPGKLAGRFDIRTQQWEYVQFRDEPQANCKVELCSLLQGLPEFSLLLFDLGYFCFAWFDYLTQMHFWFVCRLREKTTYQIVHTFYRHEGILDALVWLGSSHGARAGHLVRLVRFYDGKQVRCYLTNVLDPHQLSVSDVARLYARRWDIELAFLTLKRLLGLHHWWSSHPVLIKQQILAVLIIAQVVQAVRMQVALQAGVDPFEVSLPLLIQVLPQLLHEQVSVSDWMLTHGRELGFIRPSSRIQLVFPRLDLAEYTWAPPDVPLTRKAHYIEYKPRPKRAWNKKNKDQKPPPKPPS